MLVNVSDQCLIRLRIHEPLSELCDELLGALDRWLVGILVITNLVNCHYCVLLLRSLKPFCDVIIIKTNRTDLDLAFLIGSQVLSAILFKSNFIKGFLVTSVDLHQKDLLDVHVHLLLLFQCFSRQLQLFLLGYELCKT